MYTKDIQTDAFSHVEMVAPLTWKKQERNKLSIVEALDEIRWIRIIR